MNAKNFDKLMQEQICGILNGGKKPRLLLHCCCAPCSSACLERLREFFEITVLFYNPNIESGEYGRRKDELKRLLTETGWADFLDCDHNEGEFYRAVKGVEDCAEGGERCEKCFELRLGRTAELADRGGYDYFATTLTISPLKNAETINLIGKNAEKRRNGCIPTLKRETGIYRVLSLAKSIIYTDRTTAGAYFLAARREKGLWTATKTAQGVENAARVRYNGYVRAGRALGGRLRACGRRGFCGAVRELF